MKYIYIEKAQMVRRYVLCWGFVCPVWLSLYITTGMLRLNIVDSSNDPQKRASVFFFLPPHPHERERNQLVTLGVQKKVKKNKIRKFVIIYFLWGKTKFRIKFFCQIFTRENIFEVGYMCVKMSIQFSIIHNAHVSFYFFPLQFG